MARDGGYPESGRSFLGKGQIPVLSLRSSSPPLYPSNAPNHFQPSREHHWLETPHSKGPREFLGQKVLAGIKPSAGRPRTSGGEVTSLCSLGAEYSVWLGHRESLFLFSRASLPLWPGAPTPGTVRHCSSWTCRQSGPLSGPQKTQISQTFPLGREEARTS